MTNKNTNWEEPLDKIWVYTMPFGEKRLDAIKQLISQLLKDKEKEVKERIREEMIKDANDHLKTSETIEIETFWTNVLAWLELESFK